MTGSCSSLDQGRKALPREVLERLFVAEGRSASWIAADAGVPPEIVLALVEEYGLVRRATRPGVAARIDPDELYRLRCVEHLELEELSLRLGVSPGTAWGWMRRYGIPRRALTRRQAAKAAAPGVWFSQTALVTMWEEGRTSEQISKATGIEVEAVRRRLEAAGVAVRRKNAEHVPVGDPADPLSRAVLERMYVREKMSPWEIARATNTTPRKVTYRLKRFGLPANQRWERTLLDDITPELLRSLYLDQQRSALEIADMLECSTARVYALMRECGIETRPGAVRTSGGRTPLSRQVLEELHVVQGLSAGQIAVKLGYLRPTGEPSIGQVRHALRRHGLNLPHAERVISDADLRELYVVRQLDEAQIGERLGWRTPHGKPSLAQVRQRLAEAGIERRRPSGRRSNRDTPVLVRWYREEGLSPKQIAERLGWFDAAGRPAVLRVSKRLVRAGAMQRKGVNRHPSFDAEQLRRLYIDQGLTLRQVAEHLGWRTSGGAPQVSAVQAALRSAGIATRPTGPKPRGSS